MTLLKVTSVVLLAFITLSIVQVGCNLSDEQSDVSTIHDPSLEERINLEKSTIHWLPYKRILYHMEDEAFVEECVQDRPSAIDEFPKGIWTREQRLQGIFLMHIFSASYFFIILAFICDQFFLPTVERICQVLKISPDVAATTFMATATTIPEFFANTISTFVADSDMGLSAIIGSMMFNTLGVAACAAMFTKKPIQIDWWPITRDAIIYSLNIGILVTMAWDGVIMWYETCILVAIYVLYWVLMFQNPRIMKFFKHIIEDRFMWCQRIKNYDITNQRPYDVKPDATVENGFTNSAFNGSVEEVRRKSIDIEPQLPTASQLARKQSTDLTMIYAEEEEEDYKIWEIPRGVSKLDLGWYFFTWPIRFLLHYTIPHPLKYKNWFVVSFIMCIIWIAGVSYYIFWMVIIIGDTFNIPEAIMGLTFLAFGGCMPEAISAVIVARKGSGQMGVSNALGANSLAVLFSLGLPWFIRTMADGAGSTGAYIRIYSHGIEFTIMALLGAVALLYAVIAIAGFKLRKTVGAILGVGYIVVATFAILVELDVFFEAPDRC